MTLLWALWFGGLIALFLFVSALFRANRDIAISAAPQLFAVFQGYHLALAGVALATIVGWRLYRPSNLLNWLFCLVALATTAGVVVAVWIVRPMNDLLRQGLSGSAQFRRLHGISMMLYSAQAVLLLIGGIILTFAIARSGAKTFQRTAAAEDFQA